jgi:hypothetical protein
MATTTNINDSKIASVRVMKKPSHDSLVITSMNAWIVASYTGVCIPITVISARANNRYRFMWYRRAIFAGSRVSLCRKGSLIPTNKA